MNDYFGQNLWDPMDEVENSQFENFICQKANELYEIKFEYLQKRFGYHSEVDIAIPIKKFIRIKSEQMKPFSIIRMNEGEGSVQFNSKNTNLNEYIIKRISKILYGDPTTIYDSKNEYYDLMIESTVQADIIGAPEKSFIQRRLVNENKRDVDVRAICGSINQIDILYELAINGKICEDTKITSVWLSKYLLAHYSDIFILFDNVVIITGNEGLADKIKNNLYSGNVQEILIPTQRAPLDAENKIRHWPDRYLEVIHELETLPCYSLVIVAAGILGKVYCTHAKKNGHAAIDIGHVADIWSGKISRPGVNDAFIEKWKLT